MSKLTNTLKLTSATMFGLALNTYGNAQTTITGTTGEVEVAVPSSPAVVTGAVGEIEAVDSSNSGTIIGTTGPMVVTTPYNPNAISGVLVKFDGKKIRRKLAQKLAGDRRIDSWGNCSYRQNNDGSFVPEIVSQSFSSASKPCLFIGFSSENLIEKYFLTDLPCENSPERFCFSGYLIDTKIITKIRRNERKNSKKHVIFDSVIRSKIYPTGAPDSSSASNEVILAGGVTTLKWDAVINLNTWHRFTAASHEWGYEMTDKAGKNLVEPQEGEELFPIAYASGSHGRCDFIGNSVEAVGNMAWTAGAAVMVAGGAVTGTVVGAGAGALGGSLGGPEGTVGGAISGAGIGVSLGGSLGAAAGMVYQTGGGYIASAEGYVAKSACNAIVNSTSTPNNPFPPTGNPPYTVIVPDDTMSGACKACSGLGQQLAGSTSRMDGDDVEVVGHMEMVCTEWTVVFGGSDSNGDGFCD